ncbi:DMP19 family protein [Bradyrhizobium oligotrophicum S58]
MLQLIDQIILPGERRGPLDQIKAWLGIGGVAESMRRMGVPPLTADLMAAQTVIDEVTRFAHCLWERHVRDDEMPIEVIHVSRVNYLVGEVLNGGFQQFVDNSGWDAQFIGGVRSGLKAIGAVEHLAVFEGAVRIVDAARETASREIDDDNFQAALDRLESEHLSNAKLSRRLRRRVDDSWHWGNRWDCVQFLNARYIDRWRGVRRVPAAEYETALDALAAGIPDVAARRKMREDSRPWEKKAIDLLVAEVFLSDIWYTAFGARDYNGRKVWCWNFTVGKTPGQGHHQAIFVDGKAIMFEGHSDKIVSQRPAPESLPGSGVASNEPHLEPGTEGKNIILRISNP